jgi:hypothetical protein
VSGERVKSPPSLGDRRTNCQNQSMPQDLTTIFNAANVHEAELLREDLADCGISAYIANASSSMNVGLLQEDWMVSPRVMVANEDAAKARDVAVRFEAELLERKQRPEKAEPDVSTMIIDDEDAIWPRCPQCHERRLAVCRICETAGSDFPLAYEGPTAPEEDAVRPAMMVVCPTCDEPFYPRYYKLCEHCGHEFPDGVALPQPPGAPQVEPANFGRVLLILAGTIGVLGAIAFYLWWIVQP